jgi:hypothetical protein
MKDAWTWNELDACKCPLRIASRASIEKLGNHGRIEGLFASINQGASDTPQNSSIVARSAGDFGCKIIVSSAANYRDATR